MFDILNSSRRRPRWSESPGFVASAALHAVLASAALYQGAKFVSENVPSWSEMVERALYIAPPNIASRASREQLAFRVESGAGGKHAPNADHGEAARGAWRSPEATTGTPVGESNETLPAASSDDVNAYRVIEVEQAAETDPASAAPEYPRPLLQLGVEGYAAMRFVVDTTGLVDPTTIRVLDATHPAFADAVRDAMPRMRFRPARIGDKPVRQLSEQLFQFRMVRDTARTASTPPSPDRLQRRPTDPPGPLIRVQRP